MLTAIHLSPALGTAANLVSGSAGQLSGSVDRFPLAGRLYCRCGARFVPSWSLTSAREYRSACGCRLRPIDAAAVEHRVIGEPVVNCLAPAGRPRIGLTELIGRRCQRIEIGGTLDHILVIAHP